MTTDEQWIVFNVVFLLVCLGLYFAGQKDWALGGIVGLYIGSNWDKLGKRL